jgi:hypothetical protein
MPLRMERAPLLNHLTRCIYFLSLFFFPTDQFPLELMWLPPKGQCWMLLRERVLWLQAKRLPLKHSRFNPHLFKKNFINFSVVRLLAPLVLQAKQLLRERVLWLQAKRLPPKRSRFNPHLFKKNFINFSVVRLLAPLVLQAKQLPPKGQRTTRVTRLLAPLVLQAKQLPPKGQRTTRVTRSRFNSHLFKKTFINFSVVRLLAALVL